MYQPLIPLMMVVGAMAIGFMTSQNGNKLSDFYFVCLNILFLVLGVSGAAWLPFALALNGAEFWLYGWSFVFSAFGLIMAYIWPLLDLNSQSMKARECQ